MHSINQPHFRGKIKTLIKARNSSFKIFSFIFKNTFDTKYPTDVR